jgi:hypothetical protein
MFHLCPLMLQFRAVRYFGPSRLLGCLMDFAHRVEPSADFIVLSGRWCARVNTPCRVPVCTDRTSVFIPGLEAAGWTILIGGSLTALVLLHAAVDSWAKGYIVTQLNGDENSE